MMDREETLGALERAFAEELDGGHSFSEALKRSKETRMEILQAREEALLMEVREEVKEVIDYPEISDFDRKYKNIPIEVVERMNCHDKVIAILDNKGE